MAFPRRLRTRARYVHVARRWAPSASSGANVDITHVVGVLALSAGTHTVRISPPQIRAVGTIASGTSTISPGLPSGTVAGDLLLMILENTGTESAPTATGWTELLTVANTGTDATRLTVLYKVAEGSDSTTTNDPGDHIVGRIVGIKAGTYNSSDPFDAYDTYSGTSATTPSITTSIDNTLVLAVAAHGWEQTFIPTNSTTEWSSWTNANLSSVTEQIDNRRIDGNDGAIGVASGAKASAGSTGTTSFASVNGTNYATATISISPYDASGVSITHTVGVLTLSGGAHVPAIEVPSTVGALALSASTHTPVVTVAPSVGTLALSAGIHSVSGSSGVTLAPSVGTLALSAGTHTPAIEIPHAVVALALSGGTHTVFAGTGASITATVGALVLGGGTHAIVNSSRASLTPTTCSSLALPDVSVGSISLTSPACDSLSLTGVSVDSVSLTSQTCDSLSLTPV